MSSLNRVSLIGNLGRDPEARSFANGGRVVSFSLATSETWTDKASGERREKTEWHNVVIRNEKLGEIAERYLRKGSKAYLEGSIQSRKYEKDGQERTAYEIILGFDGKLVLLGDKGEAPDERLVRHPSPSAPNGAARAASTGRGRTVDPTLDDPMPF